MTRYFAEYEDWAGNLHEYYFEADSREEAKATAFKRMCSESMDKLSDVKVYEEVIEIECGDEYNPAPGLWCRRMAARDYETGDFKKGTKHGRAFFKRTCEEFGYAEEEVVEQIHELADSYGIDEHSVYELWMMMPRELYDGLVTCCEDFAMWGEGIQHGGGARAAVVREGEPGRADRRGR